MARDEERHAMFYRGVSQIVHCVAAALSFLSWQTEQVHDPEAGRGAGFIPAAAQSKQFVMSEEEERELAELMSDEDV